MFICTALLIKASHQQLKLTLPHSTIPIRSGSFVGINDFNLDGALGFGILILILTGDALPLTIDELTIDYLNDLTTDEPGLDWIWSDV